ncbi:hypothetical protein [Spiroplasma endosymbiont of Aspidapion aeneum]|uniref:hypothetical protein n=1 Tax=Spiroplasma endosymbiont of Aspidapion aeneum TaxID=3066276 RepID=UPI00313F15DE
MIENFTKINLAGKDIKYLHRVNGYWIKSINKSLSFLNKTKNYFGNQDRILLSVQGDDIDYQKMISEFNHFKEFFDKKYKIISPERKVYNKFRKFIKSFILLSGYYSFLLIVIKYFKTLEEEHIEKKVNFVIGEINTILNAKFDAIVILINKIIPKDKYIEYILDSQVYATNQIFNPELIIRKITSYLSKMARKKKLTEENSFTITRNFFEFIIFRNSINQIAFGFLDSLNS